MDDQCTQPYTFDTMPKTNITVYAKWHQKQYRVFLHPNVPTTETSFEDHNGLGDQETSFRISYGKTIETIKGYRDDYELIGWYTDEACTIPFNFNAYPLNDVNVTTPYNTALSTETNIYGIPTENTNKDVLNNRYWITKQLDLYAKWRSKLDGASGIQLEYVDEVGTGDVPVDATLYTDSSKAMAKDSIATAPEGMHFAYWVLQTWNEEE